MSNFHTPVMLQEATEALNIKSENWYIDCNLGGGGHAGEILKKGGKVLGIDLDPQAISEVKEKFGQEEDLIVVESNFNKIDQIVEDKGIKNIQGILFDLGVSSFQFETSERGFSFSKNAPLDMRMSPELGVTAADLVNALGEKELADVFFKYGEEPLSRVFAKRIVQERKNKKIETTSDLVGIILTIKKPKRGKIHPATLVFQALRIVVNDELNSLEESLPKAIRLLGSKGRLVVISFHSLEDRIVKNTFREFEQKGGVRVVTKTPLITSDEEIQINPRSRSAKLRILEKL